MLFLSYILTSNEIITLAASNGQWYGNTSVPSCIYSTYSWESGICLSFLLQHAAYIHNDLPWGSVNTASMYVITIGVNVHTDSCVLGNWSQHQKLWQEVNQNGCFCDSSAATECKLHKVYGGNMQKYWLWTVFWKSKYVAEEMKGDGIACSMLVKVTDQW